ncbi:MAG: hypothetical protein FJ108_06755 [Deltaproteobacteria bacterium]|nr:hypothetical protein [Deltaproteobacteria bacterium]
MSHPEVFPLPRLWLYLLLALGALSPRPAVAVEYTFGTPIAGDSVPVTLSLSDAPGNVGVDVVVSIPAGQGDLLGLFGNVANEALVPLMVISDPSGIVTQSSFNANKVWKVGGGNVMNPVGNWDWGLRFGCNGSAGGAVQSASFRIIGPGVTVSQLTSAANQGWLFGVRIQSTPGPAGSAKVGLLATQPPNGQAPTIAISSPADGLLTAGTPIAVSGTLTGTAPVSVTVNGVSATVTGSSYSASVPLTEGANTLSANATNSSGFASTAVSVTLDTTPPVVILSAPADGGGTGASSVNVTGTVADASAISSFTVNGTAATLTDGAYTMTLALVVGENPITATATDAAGNTGSAAISVTRATPPTIAIDAPATGLLTGQSPIAVTGTVSGTAPLVVNVNGVAAAVTGASFSASVPLEEGANAVFATATNIGGSDSASVSVTLDTIPPGVTIAAPANGAVFSSTPQVVAGTVLDASPITALSIAGSSALPANSFTRAIDLQSGLNPIAVEATDAAGNTGFASLVVTLQTAAPPLAIAIRSPPDGARVSTPFLSVSGSLSDPNASVAVGGVAAESSPDGFVAPVVVLAEGDNLLVATARRGSETATDSVTVRYEKPPAIFILHPRNGMRLRQAAADVSGFVDEPAAAVDVNGVTATVDETGGFVARNVPLSLGDNPLVAQAVDLEGGVGSDTAIVNRDDALAPLLRLVLYDPGRFGIGYGASVADGFAAFRRLLSERSLAPEQFSPPVDRIVVGQSGQVYLYVFAEEAGTVTIPEVVEFETEPTQELRPIEELPLELDPATVLQILPLDFEPRFFARYFLLLPEGES